MDAGESKIILWPKVSWNPVTGCSKISAGCSNCYAATICPPAAGDGAETVSRRGLRWFVMRTRWPNRCDGRRGGGCL